ncbi:PH domain-containing protein [Sporosarcina ureilytica]|uniref:Uncharacterized protein YyaB-like PH domain-containing protein n=1 Tax=Sporosarcina ureilytica TaxID=298596 RepID=A0A1D8JDR9_9BACL|nr:PH domain-containing protein [Sporosarcina ureilytica]AOV06855.1 hypothetical protein BI350_04245 [Sporosarcina ureilytica]
MTFRSKVDNFFMLFMVIVGLIIGAVTLLPLYFAGGDLPTVLTLISTFLFTIGLILWCTFNVKYVFYEDFLFVQGGPFRSRIPYNKIIKIAPTTEILTGYRILTSRDAIEIFYKFSLLGSVKISPEDQIGFIAELKKRCPNIYKKGFQ